MDLKRALELQKKEELFRMVSPGRAKGWVMHTILNVYEEEKCPTGHVGVVRVRCEESGTRYRIPLFMFEEFTGPVSSNRTKPRKENKKTRSSRTKPRKEKSNVRSKRTK